MAPHFTYYIKVSGSSSVGGGNVFWLNTGDGSWTHPWTQSLDYHVDCPNQKIYKFDQSDPSNAGHPLNFSLVEDGTHSTGVALGTGDGVTIYGIPGSSGSSTKFNVGQFISGAGHPKTTVIYPYCPNHSGMGEATQATINEEMGYSCTDGDYSGELCGISSTSSGKLHSLMSEVSSELAEKYGNSSVLSYSYVTGKETGSFFLCEAVASGSSSGDSVSRLTNILLPHFSASGICINELIGDSSELNVNNVNLSFGGISTTSGATWFSSSSGFSDARYYVGYNPQISGNNTGVTVSTTCSDTNIKVELSRNKLIYDTTGLISLPEDTITQFIATLNVNCTGHETTLEATCLKYHEGLEKLGKITFNIDTKDAWSGYLSAGSYSVKYLTGSFLTSLGMHTLGSGTIGVDKYV